jgi:hypothetical protein
VRQKRKTGRQIKITKLTKERTIQHLLNVCFAVKNILNFAMPANQNQAVKKLLLGRLALFLPTAKPI